MYALKVLLTSPFLGKSLSRNQLSGLIFIMVLCSFFKLNNISFKKICVLGVANTHEKNQFSGYFDKIASVVLYIFYLE